MAQKEVIPFLELLRKWLGRGEASHAEPVLVDTEGWDRFESGDAPKTSGRRVGRAQVDLDDLTTEHPVVTPDADDNKRPARSIAVLSGKGGVGKTTTLLGLAGAAAAKGKSVLIIDLDPQGSLSLAATDGNIAGTALDAFTGATVAALAQPSVWKDFTGKISIVPAKRSLASVDLPVDVKHKKPALADVIGDLSGYDLVLVDAPATLSSLTYEAISLADTVLVVAEPTRFSLSSAGDAVDFALDSIGRASKTKKVHVLLNKVDASEESQYRAGEIREILPNLVLQTSVTASDEINYANGAGVPVQSIPGVKAQRAGREFATLLTELLG